MFTATIGVATAPYIVTKDTDLTSAEVYDPSTRAFHVTGSLLEPREGGSAVPLTDGRVLVVGGGDSDPASAELYQP